MSPEEVKGYVDIVVSLLGAGGFGAIVLAIIGIKRGGKADPAPEERPNLGHAGMHQLGGMLAGEHFGMELLEALRALANATRLTGEIRERGLRQDREIADDARNDRRKLHEHLDTLGGHLKNLKAKD